jgi:hypothetical protein
MEAMGTIGGGAIVVKKYQASATMGTAGVLVNSATATATDLASVVSATASDPLTTGSVGVSLDESGTIGATGTTLVGAFVSVAVNPNLIIRVKMNAGATADTGLTVQACNADSSSGITAGNVTTEDEGIIWGYDGANKGIYRRLDSAAGSVTINFPNAITSGDKFLSANSPPCVASIAGLGNGPNLTTDFTQGDATTTVPGDNETLQCFEVQLGTEDGDGENNSFWHMVMRQSVFGGNIAFNAAIPVT